MADNTADILNFSQRYQTQTRVRTDAGLDANPDDAARSIDLADSTGVPASVISGDLENFDRRYQSQLAQSLVLSNPALSDYVNRNPLAASVSNDDWGNLDRISQKATWLGKISEALGRSWQVGVGEEVEKGAREGWGEGPIVPVTPEALARQYPALTPGRTTFSGLENLAATGILDLGDLVIRGGSALIGAITGGVGGLAGAVVGEQAGKEAKALTEYEIIKPEAHGAGGTQAATIAPDGTVTLPEFEVKAEPKPQPSKEISEEVWQAHFQHGSPTYWQDQLNSHPELAGQKPYPGNFTVEELADIERRTISPTAQPEPPGLPWAKAGREPPAGLSTEVDNVKARLNAQAVDQLDDLVADAQTSTTKERSPQLFQEFFNRHPGMQHASIGINGDAVAALYRDKVPSPNDGLLGWVPGIADKLDLARKSGADVDVPISDWVTHVDPEVAKLLHDHIRMWDGGITADEARSDFAGNKPDSDLGQVREAAGLNSVVENVLKQKGVPELVQPANDVVPRPGYTVETPNITGTREYFDIAEPRPIAPANLDRPEGLPGVEQLPIEDVRPRGERAQEIGERIVGREAEREVAEQKFQLRPSALGLDLKAFEKIQEDLRKRREEDLAATEKFAEREQARRQSAEWKDNLAEMQRQVEEEFRRRPDILADLAIGNGEINGEKLRQRIPLREGDLTAEQQASLPKHYVAASGVPIDDLARVLGFSSGDEMVESLARYRSGVEGSPREALEKAVKAESTARMEAKYGKLAENILTAAKDQAFSENDLQLLVDEYLAAALQAGKTVVGKDEIKAQALEDVGKIITKDAKAFKFEREVAKQYRLANNALIAENPAEALRALELRVYNAFLAAEVKKVEKAKEQLGDLFKTLRKLPKASGDNVTAGRDPEYLNYEHQIMYQVGEVVSKRSPQAIADDIAARGTGTLQQFAEAKAGAARVMPVWDQLFDPTYRTNWKDLTVKEFNALHETLKSMDHNARQERKIVVGLEKMDRDKFNSQAIDELKRFPKIKYGAGDERLGWGGNPLAAKWRSYIASIVQMETLLNYWDRFDKWGLWNQGVMRGLIDGANQADRWKKEATEQIAKLKPKFDFTKRVDNSIFRNPLEGPGEFGDLLPFNVENLIAVILKSGNSAGKKSNLFKLAGGYYLKPEEVVAWRDSHSLPEHWDYAQGIWDIWKGIKEKSDTMFRNQSGGVAPDMIKIDPITVNFKDGTSKTYAGGYYPVNDWHPRFKAPRVGGDGSLFHQGFTSATAMPGWTMTRTGYVAAQRLDLSNLANLMGQHLHDTAMRPAIINASKVLMDEKVQNAIKLYAGDQYAGLMKPYLEGLANRTNYASTHPFYASNLWLEAIRQNLVTTLVGLNIGTVLKHGPTAFGLSTKEEGQYFLKAVRMLYASDEQTREANHKFLNDNFLELDRRRRNWRETLYGEIDTQRGGLPSKYETLRQEIAKWSSEPVAFSDMLSAKPTALAGFLRAQDEGLSFGDSVYAGERAVRRAHGSTAITNRPALMRDVNPWLTSIYNFFNDIFNRQLETVWRAGEMVGEAKAGDKAAAWKHVPEIAGGLFAYAIWPAIVEQVVQNLFAAKTPQDKKESWTEKIIKGGAHMESSTLPFVRDFANFLVEGGEPTMGLAGTALKEIGHSIGDITKKEPLSPQHAQRMIHDWAGLAGMMTGVVPQAAGNVASFGYGVHKNIEHPKGPWGWIVGPKTGTLRGRPSTFQNYWEGKNW